MLGPPPHSTPPHPGVEWGGGSKNYHTKKINYHDYNENYHKADKAYWIHKADKAYWINPLQHPLQHSPVNRPLQHHYTSPLRHQDNL